jgi:hypothetical protein
MFSEQLLPPKESLKGAILSLNTASRSFLSIFPPLTLWAAFVIYLQAGSFFASSTRKEGGLTLFFTVNLHVIAPL